ncbi:type II secretion system protein [Patescibacteria group bacterium]|nr:MAG: type II secretion system protein [Patescibacteria group bacterium]
MIQDTRYKIRDTSGQLLVEAVLAIALLGILAGIIGMAVNVSTQTNKASGKKTVAVALAQEAIEAVRAIKDNNETTGRGWNKIYEKNKGSGNTYYPANTVPLCGSAIWCLVSGSEEIVKDGVTYTRSLYIDNVCRDAKNGGGDITATGACNETTNFNDPSTQYVRVTVTASGISDIIVEEYLTRAKNETKVWDSDDTIPETTFKTGATCSSTKVTGSGTSALIELSSVGGGC